MPELVNLTEVRALCAAATAGPWHHDMWERVRPDDGSPTGHDDICHVYGHRDSREKGNREFIAASRTLLPAMADELERLRDLLKRCEPFMADVAHSDACDCEDCELYREVRRVNQETPDAT